MEEKRRQRRRQAEGDGAGGIHLCIETGIGTDALRAQHQLRAHQGKQGGGYGQQGAEGIGNEQDRIHGYSGDWIWRDRVSRTVSAAASASGG